MTLKKKCCRSREDPRVVESRLRIWQRWMCMALRCLPKIECGSSERKLLYAANRQIYLHAQSCRCDLYLEYQQRQLAKQTRRKQHGCDLFRHAKSTGPVQSHFIWAVKRLGYLQESKGHCRETNKIVAGSIYIGNVTKICETWQQHLSHAKAKLNSITESGMKVKLNKSFLFSSTFNFVGRLIMLSFTCHHHDRNGRTQFGKSSNYLQTVLNSKVLKCLSLISPRLFESGKHSK